MELIPVLCLVLIGYSFISSLLAVVGAGNGHKLRALIFFLVISALIASTIFCWFEYGYIMYVIAAIVAFVLYLEALNRRVFDLKNSTIKMWNYLTLASGAVMLYMAIFYAVSKYVFHIHITPELVGVNMLMVVVLVILLPIVNELNTMINSRVMVQRVDLTYVIKKLNRLATQNVKLDRLAGILAKYLHFRRVGIILNGKLYSSSKKLKLSKEDIAVISMLESDGDVWQKVTGKAKRIFENAKLNAVAEMRDVKGRPFGQIVIGQPLGKVDFDKRDLNEISAIINLVASIVDSEEKSK